MLGKNIYPDKKLEPSKHQRWADEVKKRDGCCRITGRTYELEAHHLYSQNKYPKLKYYLSNGVTLNKEIHVLFHILYGISNTDKQFKEFTYKLSNKFLLKDLLDLIHGKHITKSKRGHIRKIYKYPGWSLISK